MNRGLWVALAFALTVVINPMGAHAAKKEADKDKKGAQDVDTLLNTLNELLEENRKMREELLLQEDELKNTHRENSVLRSQVRRTERIEVRETKAETDKLSELEKAVEEESARRKLAEEERAKAVSDHEVLKKRVEDSTAEAQRLQSVLDTAILESERLEYLDRIRQAEETAERSLRELAATRTEAERLRGEMAAGAYELGNTAFDRGDYDAAVKHYQKNLEWTPHDSWTHHNLGIIYDYYLHQDALAIYHYNQYLKTKPAAEEGNSIKERILEMELKKNIVPPEPLRRDFYQTYTKRPR